MSGGEPSSIKQYFSCDMVNSFNCMLNHTFWCVIIISETFLSEVEATLYKALYRKWRPKTFEDVIGQNHVTEILKNEICRERICHAYLFTGSRGTGKTSCAKILAKAINCEKPVNGNPCEKCAICTSSETENGMDIVEIDAASNNSVENIRDMREEIAFTPSKCKYKIYIVDEVHMLSSGAFNAFLKTLEEPPPHVVFILATTEIHKLPATIISRCQKFQFYRLSENDIIKRLKYICQKENIQIDDPSLHIIAKSADGAMRDALSILDQCANSCDNTVSEESVIKILGLSGADSIKNLGNIILQGKCSQALAYIEKLNTESKNLMKLCSEITLWFREIMVKKFSGEDFKNNILCKNISEKQILRCLEILQSAYQNMSMGNNKKLETEIAVLKLCLEFSGEKPNMELKNTPQTNSAHTPAEKSSNISDIKEKSAKPPKLTPPADTEKNSSGECALQEWGKVIEKLKLTPSLKSLWVSLKDSSAYESGSHILIKSNNSMAFELLRKTDYRTSVKKIISEVLGKSYNIGPYEKKEPKTETQTPLDSFINLAKAENINITLKDEGN